MSEHELQALLGATVLALVHLFSGRLRFMEGIPRSRWLSAFGGISVAYVFAHLMPELAEGQAAVEEGGLLAFLEDHVYLMALAGLTVFYAVEVHSLQSRRNNDEDRTGQGAFRLSIASFSTYNAVIGYLLLREELEETSALALFTLALAVHFVVNDLALGEHHKQAYTDVGRWVVAAAVFVGWAIGTRFEIAEHALVLILAFIAGGVILNVLKEELPGERRARLLPFVLGAAGYTALLQLG